ncbi:MAG: PDZ domain-containing protein [bacterium]
MAGFLKRKNSKRFLILLFFFLAGFIPFKARAEPTGGIGVILEFLPDKKVHRVRAVFQGSPAAKAKIQPGEEILSINGTSTSSMSFDDLGKRIRGNPGETLTLILKTPGSGQTREVQLTRVGQQTVSPLILTPGSTPTFDYRAAANPKPTLTEAERNQVKEVIARLKTPDEQARMKQLLVEFRDKKITKEQFFARLKTDFPATAPATP